MQKHHRIIKCFLPLLTVLYVVIFTLLIGMITDREAVSWYHYALEMVAYMLFVLLTAFFLKKCYPKIFPESVKYSFCLPPPQKYFWAAVADTIIHGGVTKIIFIFLFVYGTDC